MKKANEKWKIYLRYDDGEIDDEFGELICMSEPFNSKSEAEKFMEKQIKTYPYAHHLLRIGNKTLEPPEYIDDDPIAIGDFMDYQGYIEKYQNNLIPGIKEYWRELVR